MAIRSNYPDFSPSFNMDFANTKKLDPRITFVRSTTATYYDGKTTAKAEENLITYSEQFDNAAWSKTSTTITANSLAAPDGATTADTLTASAANGTTLQSFNTGGGDYTFSVWLRRKTGTGNIDITCHSGGTWVTQSITSSWARYSLTQNLTAGTRTAGIRIVTSGDEVYAWGAQLEQRGFLTAYTPTTTSTITNYIPVLQIAASGQARFDHNPTTGESLGLMIEEQRTNLLLRSAEFDNASWSKLNISITANQIIAPDGTLTADAYVLTSGNLDRQIFQTISLSNSTTYTLSFYIKRGTDGSGWYELTHSSGTIGRLYINTNTGAIGTGSGGTSTNVGNGWYRYTYTFTTGTSASSTSIYLCARPSDNSVSTETGTGNTSAYIWGAQLEQGGFATSYIPTTSASVQRNLDQCRMYDNNLNWLNNAEGTFVATTGTLYNMTTNRRIVEGNGQIVYISLTNGNATSNDVTNTNGIQSNVATSPVTNNITYGMSYYYGSSGNVKSLTKEGATPATGTMNVLAPPTILNIGNYVGSANMLNGRLKRLTFYPVKVTDAQLQSLTLTA